MSDFNENKLDLTTPEGVRALMASSESEREWNDNCDKVKDANGGYPSFWFPEIMLSGLAAKVQENFGRDERRIQSVRDLSKRNKPGW